MMESLKEFDKDLFLYLNGLHASWLDQPMFVFSNTVTWIPLYAFLLYLFIRDYGRDTWIFLLGVVLTIVLADQISSSLIKPVFERLRPSHDPTLKGMVHYVNDYHGGLYGFVSSHAANTFGTATFFFLLFRRKRKGIFVLYSWALFVSFTRIYLGVHYPGDIVGGALVGVCCAYLCHFLTTRLYVQVVRMRQELPAK